MITQKHNKPYPLPDSTHGLWRVWCCECGEPMRVPECRVGFSHYCNDCDPKPLKGHSPAVKDDISPWQENAIRCLEDM